MKLFGSSNQSINKSRSNGSILYCIFLLTTVISPSQNKPDKKLLFQYPFFSGDDDGDADFKENGTSLDDGELAYFTNSSSQRNLMVGMLQL